MKKNIAIAAICFLTRAVFLIPFIHLRGSFPSGNDNYWKFPTDLQQTYYEPAYALFLTAARFLSGDYFFLTMLWQIAVGSAGAVYLHKLSALLSKDDRVGWIAALLYSFYPYYIRQSISVMEVTLLTTLLIMAAYYFCRMKEGGSALSCGVAFGLSILTRVTIIPIWIMGLIYLFFKKRFSSLLIVAVSACVLYLPYGIHNFLQDCSFLPTRGGENFYIANCEFTAGLLPEHTLDYLHSYIRRVLTEERPDLLNATRKEKDDFYMKKGLEFATNNPRAFIKIRLTNMMYLFYPRIVPFNLPVKESQAGLSDEGKIVVKNEQSRGVLGELAHTVSFTFIFLTALAGIYFRRKEFRTDFILYTIGLGFIGVYSFYWPSTRFRSPMDFILMFFSACAISHFLTRRKLVLD